MAQRLISLDEFIIEKQEDFPHATGELSSLLRTIGFAAKVINSKVNKAGLADIIGEAELSNATGDDVKKLDIIANTYLKECLKMNGDCCGLASEEEESFVYFDNEVSKNAKYMVLFDPLDGSSNIDVNVSIGTIFSILRRKSTDGPLAVEDFLQKGCEQVAAGYVVYGSSTMMVYSTGTSVNGFTLDPGVGEFCLSHRDMKIPNYGSIYSINHGNFESFTPGVKKYLKKLQSNDNQLGKAHTQRYIGSMIADVHRTLIKGGIFMYPLTTKSPNGKLRLMYECNPMAMLIENAGGIATDGKGNRVMEVQPTELHQRVPVYLGSSDMVKEVEQFISEETLAEV